MFPSAPVGNPLLSERDGNIDSMISSINKCNSQSETHYSLKEMETPPKSMLLTLRVPLVGNPLLSERDGNRSSKSIHGKLVLSRKPTTL